MELRPRRGRSSQPSSTPTIAKPSPRPPPQSSARKKPAPPPATPIYIPSDDEGADAIPIRDDVAVAATGDEPALKQVDQDIIPPNNSEFETPLSRIAKVRRVQKTPASSNAKGKNKVTSSVKNIVEVICSTPVASKDSTCIADTCMEEACIADDSSIAALEKVELNEATTGRVPGARNGDVAMEEKETPEVLSENVSTYSSIESAGVEISVLVQKMGVKKVEVLSPSDKGKKGQSSKKKSGKKRAENTTDNVLNGEVCYEAADAETDQVDANAPVFATDFQEDHHTISLILSDDETGQVLKDAIWCEAKASASNEAGLAEHGQAEVSNARSKGKKRSKKKDNIEEENCGRKLFDENNDVSLAHMDKEPEDQLRHKLDTTTNLRKEEGERRIDIVNIENYEEERVITDSKRPTCESPRRNLKAHTVADLEMLNSDGGKLGLSTAAGMEGKGFGNVYVDDVSEDSSHGAVSSSDEGDEDTGNDQDDTSEVKHEETKTSFEGNSVHDVECNNSDDNDNVSSCSDDDDGEDEMASVFVNSMKAHLQMVSGPSVINMPKEALERTESPSTKVAVEASCVNGSNGSSTGYGLSWSPDIVLSASKSLIAQAGKSRNIAEARPNTIWGRDQCLQDGLCVPPVDPLKLNKLAKRQKDDTTGAKWFNLAAPTITPEIKKELQILKLRGALDPKRHYKAEDSKGLPKYFQIGTVVGGPADFYSGRLTKKEQKTSLAGELLSDSSLTAYRKRKYTQIQDQKQAGGKGFWKKNKSKRTPAWAKI